MTERENMQLVWDHKTPEWVPVITLASQMLVTMEINDRPLFQDGEDWFGVKWEIDPENPLLMTHCAPNQIKFDDMSEWKKHVTFPSCKDLDWDAIGARTKAMWAKKEELMGYVVGNMGCFERSHSLMGFENALCALLEEPEAFAEFADAYADYRIEQMEYIKKYMDPDFFMMHDDWGNQQNLFMPPDTWRKIFKPSLKRMVDKCHELGMYYMHHSCGFIEPIIEDMVEVGVDSWHSVSPVNDLAKIKEEYGNKLVFAGGVDPQITDAPGATEEDIRKEVRRAIDVLGKDGGFLCSSAVMFSTVPGVDAMIEDEATKYGKYK